MPQYPVAEVEDGDDRSSDMSSQIGRGFMRNAVAPSSLRTCISRILRCVGRFCLSSGKKPAFMEHNLGEITTVWPVVERFAYACTTKGLRALQSRVVCAEIVFTTGSHEDTNHHFAPINREGMKRSLAILLRTPVFSRRYGGLWHGPSRNMEKVLGLKGGLAGVCSGWRFARFFSC